MTDLHKEARGALTNCPEEVFTLWLDDRILMNGWPPSGTEWCGFLRGYSLEYWKNLKWVKRSTSLSYDLLSFASQEIVDSLLEANLYDRPNHISEYVPNSKKRYAMALKYIMEQRALPGPVILLNEGQSFEIVDGCHRISALVALQRSTTLQDRVPEEIQAWIAQK